MSTSSSFADVADSSSENIDTGSESLFTTFDHLDTPIGPDGTPYAYYEALRDEARDNPIGWSNALGGFWVVAGYDACNEIIQNSSAFSNVAVLFPAYELGQEGPIRIAGYDDPEHKRERAFVNRAFSSRQVVNYEAEIRAMTNNLIDKFIEHGEADVAHLLGEEVPARLTALMLGLPEEEGDTYHKWLRAMTQDHLVDFEKAAPVIAEMNEYFGAVMEERKRNPQGDVLSLIAHAEINGDRLTDDELRGFCITLLVGGIHNTAKSLSSSFWRLGWDVELRRRLIANPDLIAGFVDEVMRYYSPAAVVGRLLVEEDITVAGVTMRKDQIVVLALPVANRDARQFPHPDVFIADRSPNKHLALGGGIHQCLGTHLVKVEARAAIEEFLKRIPDYQLHPTKKSTWVTGQV
ncbi:MAG TPA: cytochrome P450, partial [Pseudonocardia sp.]|nr:cytochrome P450 [Pseudonocardia sp.]